MAMDLILSDTGALMIASNQPFEGDIARVDVNVTDHSLSVAFTDDRPPLSLSHTVHDRLTGDVLSAARILVVYFNGGFPACGYDVPLVQVPD
jgi:hypothetical protein